MTSEESARKIKELRLERGMTLEQVGKIVGVGKSTVRKWETGMIVNMRRDKIHALAKALGTTPAYLMGWDSNVNKDRTEQIIKRLQFDTEFAEMIIDLDSLDEEKLASIKNLINVMK
jgi:transcriptional regulator with XRE-family HTH domain